MCVHAILQISPANQTLYIDESGRLLRAVDKVSGISVIRQAPGESAEIVRQSIWTMISNRLPGYLILLAMALGWFVALGYSGIKLPQTWAALVIAGGLYWLSLQVLMPIQNAYFAWAIDPRSGSGNTYIMLLGSALIFAIIELAAMALPIVAFYLIKKFEHDQTGDCGWRGRRRWIWINAGGELDAVWRRWFDIAASGHDTEGRVDRGLFGVRRPDRTVHRDKTAVALLSYSDRNQGAFELDLGIRTEG